MSQVAAPQIYAKIEVLLDLWSRKSELANGHPFLAQADVYNGTLDVIFAVTFGLDAEDSTTTAALRLLSTGSAIELPADIDKPVEFPELTFPPVFRSILHLTEIMGVASRMPSPRLYLWFQKQLPRTRKAFRLKEEFISRELKRGLDKFLAGEQTSRSALEEILQREVAAAAKENRPPIYTSRAIYDEVGSLLSFSHGLHH